jgi:hypothetical protein
MKHFIPIILFCMLLFGGNALSQNMAVPINMDALKKLQIPVLGGCFANAYHRKDEGGSKNKRPAITQIIL